jgi:creatinine amidohydrolase
MKIARMNWMQVEEYLRSDDRVVLPLGSVEQHAYLSVATAGILAERMAADAAEPLGVPVYPALSYGVSAAWMAYPGTVTLRPETYARVIQDVLDSLVESGFRRVFILNAHQGNATAREVSRVWAAGRPGIQLRFHDCWSAPRTRARIEDFDALGLHGSWVENFPWTRLAGVELPETRKPAVDVALPETAPGTVRAKAEDGSMGGRYWRPEEQMMEIWVAAVAETRALLEDPWLAEAD